MRILISDMLFDTISYHCIASTVSLGSPHFVTVPECIIDHYFHMRAFENCYLLLLIQQLQH